MDENKHIEEKMNNMLQAMEHPEQLSEEELRALLADEECLQACRDLLDSKEALARRYAPAPDVEREWNAILRKGELPSSDKMPNESTGATSGQKHPALTVKRMVSFGITLLAAASVALFFLLRTPQYTVFESTTAAQEIAMTTQGNTTVLTVPRGMNKEIMLADGTKVWLNAESRLEYPAGFEGQAQRVVRLTGEAYLEVAKDAAHPFIVETDFMKTQVLGTAFNVRAYSPEDAHVTLVEGSVKVSDARHKKEVLMKPGQSVALQKGGNFAVNEVEATAYNSWTEGQFYFDNTELVEIMRELGRWYNINIIFTSKEAMHYRLHFQSDRSESLPQVLELLNSMQKVTARLENGKVIVGL